MNQQKVEICRATTQDKFEIIKYLQKDIETKGITADSFWHNLDGILNAHRKGTLVVIVVDGNLAGYAAYSYAHTFLGNSEIDIVEILDPYKRRGYGRKLVEWIENDLNMRWSDKCNGTEDCSIDLQSIPGSKEFWFAMGYHKYNLRGTSWFFRKRLDPPAKRAKRE